MFTFIILQPDRPSKICMILFLTKWPEMLKMYEHFEMRPLVAELSTVFNFSSATRGGRGFSNVYTFFGISGHLVKKASCRFLNDGLVVK